MKSPPNLRFASHFFLSIFFSLFLITAGSAQVPRTINYQGLLTENGSPVADGLYKLTFELHTTPDNGIIVWTEMHEEVPVTGGVFNVMLGSVTPLDVPFDEFYALAISINDGDRLQPFTPLTSAPYSLGIVDSVVTGSKVANGYVVRSLNGVTDDISLRAGENIDIETDGQTVTISAATSGSGGAWLLGGNAGTDTTVNFVGTTDEQALEFRVNNTRAMRIEPATDDNNFSPNLIAGGAGNNAADAALGATISGGRDNDITGNYATVGGGAGNTVNGAYSIVAGGGNNSARGDRATITGGQNNVAGRYSTVGGGQINLAEGFSATIGGGTSNIASGDYSTVSGGQNNEATGNQAFVGGGRSNRAEGLLAMVPGGFQSHATGFVSFAAGYNARAVHDGAFVWTDTEGIPTSFSSTAEDQFLIRAAGGVGIGTNEPSSQLTVAGIVESTTGGFRFPDGTLQTSAASGGSGDGHSLDAADGNPVNAVFVDNDGQVGMGTTNPSRDLHLKHDVNNLVAILIENNDTGQSSAEGIIFGNEDGQIASIVLRDDDFVIPSVMSFNNSRPGGNMQFRTAGLTRVTLANNGNLGIGTTTPDTRLQVVGSDNDGSTASLKITSGSQNMLLDGNEIDGDNGLFLNNNSSEDVIIANGGGNIGIGVNDATNIITVVKSSATDPVADAWTTYSSRRWKTDIEPLQGALDKVRRLRGVSYNWKDSGKHDIGLIAEEVGEVVPEVVAYEENGVDAKSVDYPRLVAVLIEAVKEQQNEIEQLKQAQTDYDKLAARLDELEKLIANASLTGNTLTEFTVD